MSDDMEAAKRRARENGERWEDIEPDWKRKGKDDNWSDERQAEFDGEWEENCAHKLQTPDGAEAAEPTIDQYSETRGDGNSPEQTLESEAATEVEEGLEAAADVEAHTTPVPAKPRGAVADRPVPGARDTILRLTSDPKGKVGEVARTIRGAKLTDDDLQWLAVEAQETSRAWEAFANDLFARTTNGKARVAKLKERAAANGLNLLLVGRDEYRLAPIEGDDGTVSTMPLSVVPQELDIAEGKLYRQLRTICGRTEPFEESNKKIGMKPEKNPDAKPIWMAH